MLLYKKLLLMTFGTTLVLKTVKYKRSNLTWRRTRDEYSSQVCEMTIRRGVRASDVSKERNVIFNY